MHVLIVEPSKALGTLWSRHIERSGACVTHVDRQSGAIRAIRNLDVSIIVLNLVLPGGSAFAIADYASYAAPDTKVLFVTGSTFFSDGSIFRHIPNACAFVGASTPPEDLAAMAMHWGGTGRERRAESLPA